MDMFNLEKLLEQAQIAEKISNGIVDDQAYNVITKAINESVLMEAHDEVEGILSRGRRINKVVDLSQLESQVNNAFGINESVQSTQTKKEPVTMKKSINEGVSAPKHTAAALGVNDAKKFQKAAATSQTKFVDANTAAVNKVDAVNAAGFKKVESKGVTNAGEKRGFADKQKGKFQANASKQEVPDVLIPKKLVVTESAKKYVSFVNSLRNKDNAPLIEAIIQGFKVSYKSGF